jgi:hypothetical protein
MIPFIKSSEYLWGNTRGENIVGNERRKRERKKEKSGLREGEKERKEWIKRGREGVLVRNGNGMG